MRARPLWLILGSALLAGSAAAEIAIRGRVADENSAPLPGATAELHPAATRFERAVRVLAAEPRRPLAVAQADEHGRFVLRAGEEGPYEVVVTADGRLPMRVDLPPIVDDVDLSPVELERDLPLLVQIADETAGPLAGAHVEVRPIERRRGEIFGTWRPIERLRLTDRDGIAVFPRGETEAVWVAAWAPGFLPRREDRVGVLSTLRLTLGTGVDRTVEVLGTDGEPAAGALVRVGPSYLPAALTGEDGRVTVNVPGRGGEEPETLRLLAETAAGDWGIAAVPAPGEYETEPPVVALKALEILPGRLLDAVTGKAVAGGWIGLRDRIVKSDRDGSFLLPFTPIRGSAYVYAVATGFLAEARPFRARRDLGAFLDLRLRPSLGLEGRVVDGAGDPVAAAKVRVQRPSDRDWDAHYVAYSDDDGGFHFHGSPQELYRLTASHDGYADAVGEGVATLDADPVVLVLLRSRGGFGYVFDLSERPVAGAEVSLWLFGAPARDSEPERRATTDDDGRFDFAELEVGKFHLRATAPGFVPYVVSGLEIAWEETSPPQVDLGTVLLEPGVRLAGQVVDPRGGPVPGATVIYASWASRSDLKPWDLSTYQVKTGEDGRFVVADRQEGEKLDLWAWKRGYSEGSARGVECPADDVSLVVEPTLYVRGRVVDGAGVPVGEALISATYEGKSGETFAAGDRTEPDGLFEVEGLEEGRLDLKVTASGFQPYQQWLELAPGEVIEGLLVRLEAGAVLTGQVLSPEGAPVRAGIWHSQSPFQLRPTHTDAEGQFRLDGLTEGPLTLYAAVTDGPHKREEVTVGPGTTYVEIRLEERRKFEVEGRVTGEDGGPLVGAYVSLGPRRTRSGEDGAFRLEKVPEGPGRLLAAMAGYAKAELELTVDGPLFGLEVELRRGGSIAGRILGLDPASYAGVKVWALHGGGGAGTSPVDYEGRYRLSNLTFGEWTVEAVESATGRRAGGRLVVESGEDVELDLEFETGLVLSGQVMVDAEPEASARVYLRGLDVVAGGWAESDYEGRFRIEDLEAGRYRLEVRTNRRELLAQRDVDVAGSQEMRLDFRTGGLQGRVVDAGDGAPLDGAEVFLEPAAGEARLANSLHTTSDSEGRFGFRRLVEGSYRLRAEKAGYGFVTTEVAVTAGVRRDDLELRLAATTALVLDVGTTTGARPGRIVAVALDAAGEPAAAEAALVADGEASLTRLPAGSWTLLVGSEGFGSVRLDVAIPGPRTAVVLPPETRLAVVVRELASGGLATVTISDAQGRAFFPPSMGNLRRRWSLRDGRVTVRGLPPGVWNVTVTAGERTWTGQAAVAGGDVELVLDGSTPASTGRATPPGPSP